MPGFGFGYAGHLARRRRQALGAAPAMLPLASLSIQPLEVWSDEVVVSGYSGNLLELCKVPDSALAGNLQNFAAASGGVKIDRAAVQTWAGHSFPQVKTIYGQLNGRNLTQVTANDRPYYNLWRGEQGGRPAISFNISNGPSLDVDNVTNTSNTRLAIPSTISAQRGAASVAMVIEVGSNASAAAGIFGWGATGGSRLIAMHADGTFATNPGLRIIHSATKSTLIPLKIGRQSVVISTGYGASGATSATNYTRVSIDGETVYQSTSSITDATITGGRIGENNPTSGNAFGEFALVEWIPFAGSLNSSDEALIHAFNASRFGTKPPASVVHVMHAGTSTPQGYRSHMNGVPVQMDRELNAAGTPVVTTSFGQSGTPISQIDTDATTLATFKYAGAQRHVVNIMGYANDVITNYTETQIDTGAEQDAAAATIYASLTSAIGKFRANTSVTGKPWRCVVQIQHNRDFGEQNIGQVVSGQNGGAPITANLVAYRRLVLGKIAALIKANAGGLAYTWWDPNDDAGVAAYPNTGSRDSDDVHMNETVGIPAAVAIGLPVLQAAASSEFSFDDLPSGSVFLDMDPATGVTLNGSTVSQWLSRRGAGTYTQATANLQPAYEATGWDGTLPQIRGDGASSNGDILTATDVTKKDSYYEFIVAKRGGATFVGGTGGVSSTTLTITSVTAGKPVVGLPVSGGGASGTATLSAPISVDSAGVGTWTLSTAQTIADGTSMLQGQNATAVFKPITENPRATGDLVISKGALLRVTSDATQDDVQISGTGTAASATLTGTAFSAGAKAVITATVNAGSNSIRVNSGSAATTSTTSSTTVAVHSLFGGQSNAAARFGGSVARIIGVDFTLLPGGLEQDANRLLFEAALAWKYGTQAEWAANHPGHPFASRAPVASDYTGNNRLFLIVGNSLALGEGQQLATAIDATLLGLTAQNGGVGGEESWQTWYRLINGYDNGGSWGAPLTTGKTTAEQAAKIVIIDDIYSNDAGNGYPIGVMGDTTPESGATPGSTPSPTVGTMWGNLYDMVQTIEARQGVSPGNARLVLSPLWEGNGAAGFNAPVRALNDAAESDPIFGPYWYNIGKAIAAEAAPDGLYPDPVAYAAGTISSVLQAAGSLHLTTAGYLLKAQKRAEYLAAKGWSL